MRRYASGMVLCLALALVSPLAAGWFGYSDEEVQGCLQKYFQKPEVALDDLWTLDMASLENNRDAKILYKVFEPMVKPLRAELDAMIDVFGPKRDEVKRLFGILYCKEIHDELWEKTRPLKQAAYRKSLMEYIKLYGDIRTLESTVVRGEFTVDALKDIGRKFKEIKP